MTDSLIWFFFQIVYSDQYYMLMLTAELWSILFAIIQFYAKSSIDLQKPIRLSFSFVFRVINF